VGEYDSVALTFWSDCIHKIG